MTFETPSEDWEKSVKRPAISCFLHRVVEDIGRRPSDWLDERGADGRVGARQPPVRHYQLHYQVSAWAKSIDEEHRLLGRVMEACLSGEAVEAPHRAGVLEDEVQPLLIRLGVPMADPGPQPHDLWTSLGLPLRASLDLTLVAPLRPAVNTDIAPHAVELTLDMERIRDRPSGRASESGPAVKKQWTAFRVREGIVDRP